MKLKKGGIEAVIAAILLVAIVIGLITTVVKKITIAGEDTVNESMNHLSKGQVKMQNY